MVNKAVNKAVAKKRMELSRKDLKLLVQSLTHCLETCKNSVKGRPCSECRSAETLKTRLERALAA